MTKEARTTFRVRPRKKAVPGWGCSCEVLSVADVITTFTNIPAKRSFLSKAQSVDQRMRLECDVGFRHTRGRAVAHVRGSYGANSDSCAQFEGRFSALQ